MAGVLLVSRGTMASGEPGRTSHRSATAPPLTVGICHLMGSIKMDLATRVFGHRGMLDMTAPEHPGNTLRKVSLLTSPEKVTVSRPSSTIAFGQTSMPPP